jgi:hypothetical protein
MAKYSEDHFSDFYLQARERFLTAARTRGAEIDGYAIAARSPKGEELSIDTAYLGPDSPQSLLAISSGIHGVEGFAGGAIQHQLLRDQLSEVELSAECGLLLIHGLNPFGFSALRRVNENNVDLNRNFVEHPEGHLANPGYEELYEAINPTRIDDEGEEENRRGALLEFAKANGFPALQAALSVGQFIHPEGVQFSGQEREETNQWLRGIAMRATRGAPRVVWLDVHTGLGPFGEVEMIMESAEESPDFLRAQAWWGECVRSMQSDESVTSVVHGSIMTGLAEALPDCDLTVVGAEFGTYDPVRIFQAMRADNWLHQHGDLDSEQGLAIKKELLEVFRPADPKWGSRVLEVGADLISRAIKGLAATKPVTKPVTKSVTKPVTMPAT